MPPPSEPATPGDGWKGMGTGWAITSAMLAGMLVWGAIGYLMDRLIWDSLALTGLGIVVGAGASVYLVYLRYGRGDG